MTDPDWKPGLPRGFGLHHVNGGKPQKHQLLVPLLDANQTAQELVYQAPAAASHQTNRKRPISQHNNQLACSVKEETKSQEQRGCKRRAYDHGDAASSFPLIHEWDIVLGDTNAREGRTTAATKALRDIKVEFKDKYFGKHLGMWKEKAIAALDARLQQTLGQVGKVLIKCTRQNKDRVQGMQRYGYAGDPIPNFAEARDAKEALTKFFHSRDAPRLANEIAGYQRKLHALRQANPRPPAFLMQRFEERILFLARQLEMAEQENDVAAKQFLKDLGPVNPLKNQWKYLLEHRQAHPLTKGDACTQEIKPPPVSSIKVVKKKLPTESHTVSGLKMELKSLRAHLKKLETKCLIEDLLGDAEDGEPNETTLEENSTKELGRSKPALVSKPDMATIRNPQINADPRTKASHPKPISTHQSNSLHDVCGFNVEGDSKCLLGLSNGPDANSLDDLDMSDPDACLRILGLDSSEDITMHASLTSFSLDGSLLEQENTRPVAVSRRVRNEQPVRQDEISISTGKDPPGHVIDWEEEYSLGRNATVAQNSATSAPTREPVVMCPVDATPVLTNDSAIPTVAGVAMSALNPYCLSYVLGIQPPVFGVQNPMGITERSEKFVGPKFGPLAHVVDPLLLVQLIRERVMAMPMPPNAVETVVETKPEIELTLDVTVADENQDLDNNKKASSSAAIAVAVEDYLSNNKKPNNDDTSVHRPSVDVVVADTREIGIQQLAFSGDVGVKDPRSCSCSIESDNTLADQKATPRGLRNLYGRDLTSRKITQSHDADDERVKSDLSQNGMVRRRSSVTSSGSGETLMHPGAFSVDGPHFCESEAERNLDSDAAMSISVHAATSVGPYEIDVANVLSYETSVDIGRATSGRLHKDLIRRTLIDDIPVNAAGDDFVIPIASLVETPEIVYAELMEDDNLIVVSENNEPSQRRLPRPWRAFAILVRAVSRLRLRRGRSRRQMMTRENSFLSLISLRSFSSRLKRGHPRVGLWQEESLNSHLMEEFARDRPTTAYVC